MKNKDKPDFVPKWKRTRQQQKQFKNRHGDVIQQPRPDLPAHYTNRFRHTIRAQMREDEKKKAREHKQNKAE